jgi:hypothetical protein
MANHIDPDGMRVDDLRDLCDMLVRLRRALPYDRWSGGGSGPG